jgi:hypothetical protein
VSVGILTLINAGFGKKMDVAGDPDLSATSFSAIGINSPEYCAKIALSGEGLTWTR